MIFMFLIDYNVKSKNAKINFHKKFPNINISEKGLIIIYI